MARINIASATLQYFPIQGRGEPIRYLLTDASIPFTESNDTASFFANKADCAEYRFQQLPRLSVTRAGSDGQDEVVHLAQQGAILRFLAKVAGYGEGADAWKEAVVDQLQDACEDLNTAYTRCIYGADAVSRRGWFWAPGAQGRLCSLAACCSSLVRAGTSDLMRRTADDAHGLKPVPASFSN